MPKLSDDLQLASCYDRWQTAEKGTAKRGIAHTIVLLLGQQDEEYTAPEDLFLDAVNFDWSETWTTHLQADTGPEHKLDLLEKDSKALLCIIHAADGRARIEAAGLYTELHTLKTYIRYDQAMNDIGDCRSSSVRVCNSV